MGATVLVVFMGASSLGSGSCTSALKRGMYMPNATWRRRGVATARGAGIAHPQGAALSRDFSQKNYGETPCGRGPGQSPLSGFCSCLFLPEGRCGEGGPPR
jgi:hypothetical protein